LDLAYRLGGPHESEVLFGSRWLARKVEGAIFLWLGLRRFESANLYIPDRIVGAHPGTYGLPYENLRLRTSDGPLIHAWYVENQPASPVILVSHGNAGNISTRLDKLLLLRKAGASVLLYDYRGYGASQGRPTEAGTYRDGEAAYRWLVEEKKVPPERIFLYGESLGCAVAIELALKLKSAGLIVDSGFTSTMDMGRLIFPFLPISLMVRFRYDNLSKIHRVSCPVLVMHSPQDEIIPYEMGQRLFEAAPKPKTFLKLEGSHNEAFMTGAKQYAQALRLFLESHLKAPKV
jgi:fermentation-respiration switch protein FrsA (DUF1100 family)